MTRSLRCSLLVLAVLAMFLTGCGDDDDASDEPAITGTTAPVSSTSTTAVPESTTTDTGTGTTTTSEPGTTPVPAESMANVYWAWTVETTSAPTPEQLGAGGRAVTGDTPAEEAMEALLEGPDELETEIGMTTVISPDTELLDLAVSDGIAVVDLSSAYEDMNGTLGETLAIAQVVFTLTQFDTIDEVSFRIDGEDRESIGPHGTGVAEPLTRDDFSQSVRPFILLESPTPGAEITDEVVIGGEANTFEANVRYEVTDGEGLTIAEGFTTATAGNGTWGTFEETVAVEAETAGVGAVIVWEESAEDGSQINLVEYPVDVGAV